MVTSPRFRRGCGVAGRVERRNAPGGRLIRVCASGSRKARSDVSASWTGVFHVEQAFLAHWKRGHRALRQRNAALRQDADDGELDAWDREFVSAALAVSEARSRYRAGLANPSRDTSAAARVRRNGCSPRVAVRGRALDHLGGAANRRWSTPVDNCRAPLRGSLERAWWARIGEAPSLGASKIACGCPDS